MIGVVMRHQQQAGDQPVRLQYRARAERWRFFRRIDDRRLAALAVVQDDTEIVASGT